MVLVEKKKQKASRGGGGGNGFNHNLFSVNWKLGHLTAYPQFQFIYNQVEKHQFQDQSLWHTTFHLSSLWKLPIDPFPGFQLAPNW